MLPAFDPFHGSLESANPNAPRRAAAPVCSLDTGFIDHRSLTSCTVDMAPATGCAHGVCWRGDRVVRWERPLCGGNAHGAGIRAGVSSAGGGWHCRRALSEITVLREHRRLRRRKVSPPHITPRSAPASPPAGGAPGPLGRRGPAPGSTSRPPPGRPLRPVAGPIAPKLPVDGPTG